MKKCPNCGYVRTPADERYAMVPANACPKCYCLYELSEKKGAETARQAGFDLPARPVPGRHRPYLTIALVSISVTLIATVFFFLGKARQTVITSFPPPETKSVQARAPEPIKVPPGNVSEIVRLVAPSVVSIVTYNERREVSGRGTGFFTSSGGEVITNHHVLKGAYLAEIRTASGNTYQVSGVISEDPPNDLVRVSTSTPASEARPLAISSYLPEIGEKVIVIGSPLGLEQTVSDGIVSAYRKMHDFKKVVQITAPMSPGSSGSPVVSLRGEIIGIAFMQMVGGQNLNFCIPGEIILGMRSGPAIPLARISPHSPVEKIYFYQDESKTVHFVKNPETPGPSYVLLTRPDGSVDRDLFENWVFEQMGGDPRKIDPQAEVNAEKERLPEYFRRIFPGHEIEELRKFSPEARGYWGAWVANHMQATYSRFENARNTGIMRHKQMMALLDRISRSPGP